MKKIKKRNLFKYLIPSIAAVVVAGTVGSVVGATVSRNNVNYVTNPTTYSDNDTSMLMNNNQQKVASEKVASDADFLLNSSNAISLSSSSDAPTTSLSVTNGPRGFISVVGGYITYTGYDGNVIWKNIKMDNFNKLIASYYYEGAKSFVLLYSISFTAMRVVTMRETDGTIQKNNTDYGVVGEVQRQLMVPIYNSDTKVPGRTYMIMSQSNQLSTQRNINIVQINSDGSVRQFQNTRFNDNQPDASHAILSAGSMWHATNDITYTFLLCQYGNGQIGLRTYANYLIKSQLILDASFASSINNSNIDKNISEIWLSMEGYYGPDPSVDPIIHIIAVLNTNPAKTKIIRGYYRISNNTLNEFDIRTINLQQTNLDYDIYRGRFYGNYFYAYLGYASYGQSSDAFKNRIMWLNLNWNSGTNWNTNGFKWNDNYNNSRIIMYDSPYFLSQSDGTIERFNQIIGLPFYTTNYDEKPNLFTVATYDNSLSSNLYLLDGGKNAYAYQTRLKNSSTSIINIPGVSSQYVKDTTDSDLRRHIDNYGLMSKHFTQYQTGSNYAVAKKTSSADIIKNYQGVIPITFTILKGYNNNVIPGPSASFVAKSFDLELTGFKAASTIINENPDVSLPSNLSNLLPSDVIVSNTDLKKYVWDNCITDPTPNAISINDLTISSIKSFNNITGEIKLQISLQKFYNTSGILVTNYTYPNLITIKGFTQVNPTTLKTTTLTTIRQVFASAQTPTLLQEIIFDRREDIFANNSIPNNFTKANIVNVSIVTNSVNDKTGVLQVTFGLNNYYDNSGILITSPNKLFGPLTIDGFLTVNKETIIKTAPTTSNVLNSILAQDIIDVSNSTFKEYLWTDVISGTKENMTSNNITEIHVRSFNNLTGTLILSSITLNKYWDRNNSLLVNADNEFIQDVTINGFKKVVSTTLKTNETSITTEQLASQTTTANVAEIIFNKKLDIFADKSIPENLLVSNIINISIIQNSVNDKTGTLQVNFELNNYYNSSGVLLTSPNKSFGPLTINGFKSVDKETTIRNNPAPSATLASILAQDITDVSNVTFKEYLWTNVVTGTKDNMSSSNITSINVKSFDNLTGTLILSSITLNKYWDSNTSLLVNGNKTFTQDIVITGFKLVVETSINNSVDSKLNSILASAATIDNLTDVIFNQRNQIFIDKGIPSNFVKDNIKNVTIIPGTINDKTGTLQVTFDLNNYYNSSGILSTSPNKSFAPLTIEGFLNLNKETTIDYISQIPNDNQLASILAQDITDLSNVAFKEYLWTNVVTGTKDNMSSSNITSINVKSFDNLTGTLILSSITLNKYWDSNTSLLVDATKIFDTQDIEISGFKSIEATVLQRQSFVFSELNHIEASNMKDDQLQDLLFGARNRIFVNNSLPDDFAQNNILNYNIVPGSADDKSGTLRVNFQINNYYKIGNGEWIRPGAGPVLEFNDITFAGFLRSGLGTALSPSQNTINLTDTFPYQITNPIDNTTLKQFIFDHIITDQNKNQLSFNDITAITLDSITPYDNKQGILKIQSITLSKWHEDNGTLATGTRIFSLENNAKIEIQGFKKVSGYTTNVTTKVNVSDELVNLTTAEVTVEQLKVWAQNNLSSLFTNLVSVPTTTNVVSVEKTNSLISTGELHVNITLNQFYENNNDFSYQNTNKKFTNIILGGFLNKSLATTTKNPTAGVSGTLADLLPQQIDEDKNNNDFKNYLISNVIVDPTNNLTAANITTFTGNYDNLTGEYTLTSITLNKSYDKDGNVVNAPITFRNFSYVITGFKNISGATSKIPDAFIDSSAPDVFADAVTKDQYTQIIKDNYLTVITNLPSSFTKDNIVNVDRSKFDNDLGYLYVDVTINKYYAANGQLMDGNFLLSNILISGYKVNSTIPEITINDRVDVTLYNSVYHSDIVGNIVSLNNIDSINLITNWLRTDAIFNLVVSNPKGLSKNDFNVSKINSINNLTGEVAVTISVTNGTIEPNKNVLTFYGFKKPIPVETWIQSIGEIKGTATTNETKINDIRKQILSLANTNNSPFATLVKETDISIVVDPQDNNKFIITINNSSYVSANGDLVHNTMIELTSTYVINTTNNSGNNDWIWILIYSLAGVIAFALLLWIIIAIIKRNKRQNNIEDDDFVVS